MMTNGWQEVLLGEFLTERRETPTPESLENGEVSIVSKIGFNQGKIELRSDGKTKTGMILIRPGDLVVSGINAAKGAIAIYNERQTKPIAATIHYSSYVPNKERVEIKYLWWFLRSAAFREIVQHHVPGGIKTELKAKRFLSVPIPLPLLDEQYRILERVEALAARITKAQSLRGEADEEANILLSRATTYVLDEQGWEIQRLENVLKESPRNGFAPQSKVDGEGKRMLRINAVSSSPNRFVDLSAFNVVDVPEEKAAPFYMQNNEVFVVRYNGDINRVAKAAIYKAKDDEKIIFPDKLIRLRANEEIILPDYLVFALSSKKVRSQIEELGKTTAGNIGISGSNIKSFMIPVPPLDEQRRIVAYLDSVQARLASLREL
jgi:type I restriction enzyme S subunit